MLFFGTRCERLCMIQFSLISLMPGLIDNLQDCADPAFDDYTQSVEKPTSLKTSDRGSCRLKIQYCCGQCTNYSSIGLYGFTAADFWQGNYLHISSCAESIVLTLPREVCLGPIPPYSNLICWPMMVQSRMSWDQRIPCSFNKKIAIATF